MDPDHMASKSGSTVVSKKDKSRFSRTGVKSSKCLKLFQKFVFSIKVENSVDSD